MDIEEPKGLELDNDDIYYNTLSSSPHLHHYVIHIEAESEISQIKKSLEDLTSSFDEFKKEAITKLDGYKE
ncbi:15731_t:CDS:2, partial [Gigaspora margarita]